MLVFSNEENSRADFPKKKTLHFEGIVDLSQKSKVTEFNGALLLLLCSLHQTTQHFYKQLTIQVSEPGPFNSTYEKALCPRSVNCLLEHCFLRERAYETVPEGPVM